MWTAGSRRYGARLCVGHAAVPGGFAQPSGGSRRLIAHPASLRLRDCLFRQYP
ncbi:MAG: hypothetical protein [Olavius algarvensis Gamma 1 endosymbiont]|nr:MAG: hypothetical protein [Olavius algarvensis Gamma 1 endosymbiont]